MPTVTPRTDVIHIKPVPGRRHALRKWLWRITSAVAIAAVLSVLVGALGAKFGAWGFGTGLRLFTFQIGKWLFFASLGLGVLSLLAGLFIKSRSKRAITAGLIGLVVGAAGVASLANMRATAGNHPIHDITTDTQNPPVFAGNILSERAATEGVNTLDYTGKTVGRDGAGELVSVVQTRLYPNIRTIVSSRSPEDALARAEAIADQLGWDVVDVLPTDAGGSVEATATTFWYGFKDDVVVRVRPGAGGGSVIDVRSISRVGGSDLGANADRIRDFIKAFGT